MKRELKTRTMVRPAASAATCIRSWRAAATQGAAAIRASGGSGYDRRRILPRLIALDPRQLDDEEPDLAPVIARRLKRALRAERCRGRAGHWTYDLNRHLALLQAIEGESELARRAGRLD